MGAYAFVIKVGACEGIYIVFTYHCQHCRDEMAFIDNTRSKYCKKPACQRALAHTVIEQKKSKLNKRLTALCETHVKHLQRLESRHHIPVSCWNPLIKADPLLPYCHIIKM